MFSASDYRRAQEPWQAELGGVVFTARLISQEQILEYNRRVEYARSAPATLTKDPELAEAIEVRLLATALRWIYRQAFPWRPWMLWRGDPVRRLFALDPEAFVAARQDFFRSLARAHAPAPSPPPAPATPSSGS